LSSLATLQLGRELFLLPSNVALQSTPTQRDDIDGCPSTSSFVFKPETSLPHSILFSSAFALGSFFF
jgi:hypothetical protein